MQTATYPDIRAPRWGKEEHEVQIVKPKKAYVYGTARNSSLVHKIASIRLRWWTCGDRGRYLVRLQSPRVTAVTKCGRYIRVDDISGRMCELPKPDAVLCASCHGKGRNFPRGRQHEIPMSIAKVRLGCIDGFNREVHVEQKEQP